MRLVLSRRKVALGGPFSGDERYSRKSLEGAFSMSQQSTTGAATVPHPPQARTRAASRKPAVGAKKGAVAAKKDKPGGKTGDGLSRGALAGRIAAGAAIGSAAIAGALLFAGKIDSKTPKQVWDKVKSPTGTRKRASAKKKAS